MRIIINHSSMIPIYEQIVDQIKNKSMTIFFKKMILYLRLLSKELRISALTVKRAYATLEEEGLTKTIHGKGTFVLAVNKDLLEEAKKEIEEYLEKALQKAKQSGVSHKEVKELLELLMEE